MIRMIRDEAGRTYEFSYLPTGAGSGYAVTRHGIVAVDVADYNDRDGTKRTELWMTFVYAGLTYTRAYQAPAIAKRYMFTLAKRFASDAVRESEVRR